uniref:Uncharacterized protein n=1 Tax=Papilio xuthus TaxID=66420 RepID=I4DQI8_PAPXU|nr:unknown unsecreted protein [Papilio xuthus]
MSKKSNEDFSNTSNENKKMEIDSVLSENANDCDHNVPTTKETSEDMIRLEACNKQITLEVREEATVPRSKILEGSGDPITPDVNREPKILDKSWESVLLEDNSETKTLEEIGETVTLESGRESTLNKSWETLLLEDSMEGETNKENGESKTPEERGDDEPKN